jgi:hypothetical protein
MQVAKSCGVWACLRRAGPEAGLCGVVAVLAVFASGQQSVAEGGGSVPAEIGPQAMAASGAANASERPEVRQSGDAAELGAQPYAGLVADGPMQNRSEFRSEAVRVTSASFNPVLAERIGGPADAVESAPEATGENDLLSALAALDPEALRVVATMSPDQIDALTLLVLSRNGGVPGGAGGALLQSEGVAGPIAAAEDAPWVGDWSEDDIADDNTSGDVPDRALPEWDLVEHPNGTLELRSPVDPITSLTVEAGLILGSYGRVDDVVRGTDEILVFLDSGAVLRGAPNPARAFRPQVRPGADKTRLLLAAHSTRDRRLEAPEASPGGDTVLVAELAADDQENQLLAVARRDDGGPPPRPALATAGLLPGSQPEDGDIGPEPPEMVVAATFATESGATELSRALVEYEMVPVVETAQDGGRTVFRVLVDPYKTAISTDRIVERLAELGYGVGGDAAGRGSSD